MWAFLGFTFSASIAALQAERANVVIATSPPLVAVIPGWIAARCSLRPSPWIFEIRDLWPESAITTGVIGGKSILARILYALERWACRSASKINVLTPAFRNDLERRGLAEGVKIVFVPNGADTGAFLPGPRDNAARREFGWGDRFVVTYAGAHGRANAVGQLVDAAECLRDRSDILIASFGDGPERGRIAEQAAERGLDNIRFYGPRPKGEMPDIVNASDAGIAVLQNNPTFRTVYPNKVFDYMSCARPVVLAIDGVARTLVCDQASAGVFAEPEDGKAIAGAILQLASDPARCAALGRNGREWVVANASRDALAARYLEVMQALTLHEAKPLEHASRAGS
jgi:glycosyltransferase involved in cell wall biosynthesis